MDGSDYVGQTMLDKIYCNGFPSTASDQPSAVSFWFRWFEPNQQKNPAKNKLIVSFLKI
jgi:hypothetical protein